MILHHQWTRCNQIFSWEGTDSQELYQKNLNDPTQRHLLEQHDWIDREIEYNYNSLGFRDQEFDDRPCGIALGCSLTEGTGLPADKTWPFILGEKIGIKIWNLGVAGASMDTCFRMLDYFIPILKPKFVILLDPPPGRLEIYLDSGRWEVCFGTRLASSDVFLKNWFINNINQDIQYRKGRLAMAMLCREQDIPFFNYPMPYPFRLLEKNEKSLARDLFHTGSKANEKFAEKIQQDIKRADLI